MKLNKKPLFLSKSRGDVIVKTILRTMRKQYIGEFTQCTCYPARSRHRGNDFLLLCVDLYLQSEFFQNDDPENVEINNRRGQN
jgi:hypothetical protein